MNYYIIPAALGIAFIITLVFSAFSKRPLRGLWVFFLILFLVTWSAQLWITPFGPVTYGISWITLIFIPLFIILLTLALIPPLPPEKSNKARVKSDKDVLNSDTGEVIGEAEVVEGAFIGLGIFFWIILLILILSIVFGYYRIWDLVA